jgi:hypothetical protein
MIKILNIKPLPNYKLHIKYNDGVQGDLDLSDLVGKGVFEKFNDTSFFENVWVGETGAPTWREELDIDPLNTYLTITGKTIEQYLNEEKANANN